MTDGDFARVTDESVIRRFLTHQVIDFLPVKHQIPRISKSHFNHLIRKKGQGSVRPAHLMPKSM
jgi:hypothetical protein